MAATLKTTRVSILPEILSPNTLYLVDTVDTAIFDIYLVSTDGAHIEHVFNANSVPAVIATMKGINNGIASLDATGKVPASQLPGFVDDVLEYALTTDFPLSGESSKIYVATTDNKIYRWSGTQYIEISASTGASDSALKLTTARVISMSGDGTWSVTFDGSANVAGSMSLSTTGVAAGEYPVTTVNSKGRVTAGRSLLASDIPSIPGSKINSDITVNTSGNAATSTKLITARTINGVAFDGTADIVVNAIDVTARIAASEKGVANGVATLDATGVILTTQLPSYVDDVVEYASFAALPVVGSTGKIFVTLDNNKTYRWSGSTYIQITSGAVDSVAGKTGVVTLVKADVGLSNVDNTSDVNKPVSTAQAAADSAVQAAAASDATTKANAAQAASTPIAHAGSTGNAHGLASASVNGFMSTVDKTKLDAITGTNTGDQTNITGNAGTATKLTTARTINGVAFDGTANITINAVDATMRIAVSEKGAANGVATLDSSGLVPSGQLPSYVDDVLEFANLAAFPVTGSTGKIYVTLDTNKAYRWSGTVYVYITSGAVDSVAGKTGIVTLVKADVGLGNVDNTSDINKPISTAVQTALDTKINTSVIGAPNGIPSLNNTGKLTFSMLPVRILVGVVGATSGNTIIPGDNSTPAVTEGTQLYSQALTAENTTSGLLISGNLMIDCGTSNRNLMITCFKNSVCIGTMIVNFVSSGRPQIAAYDFYDPDFGATVTATYSIRFGTATAATWYVNRTANSILNGTMSLNRPIRFEEINV